MSQHSVIFDPARTVVFLGPTLPKGEAKTIFPGFYRPPVAIGDVFRAVQASPQTLLIVDGYFEGVPSVWHKEILYALACGVRVYGCSSMGALRAAELSAHGMVGVGRIYDMYADGSLEDDDEVAVTHASADSGYRCASHAMVNLRHGLRLAVDADVLSASQAADLGTRAKELFYADRHWGRVVRFAVEAGLPPAATEALSAIGRSAAADLKRQDALMALRGLADHSLPMADTPIPPFVETNAWGHFVSTEGIPATAPDGDLR